MTGRKRGDKKDDDDTKIEYKRTAEENTKKVTTKRTGRQKEGKKKRLECKRRKREGLKMKGDHQPAQQDHLSTSARATG